MERVWDPGRPTYMDEYFFFLLRQKNIKIKVEGFQILEYQSSQDFLIF